MSDLKPADSSLVVTLNTRTFMQLINLLGSGISGHKGCEAAPADFTVWADRTGTHSLHTNETDQLS